MTMMSEGGGEEIEVRDDEEKKYSDLMTCVEYVIQISFRYKK